MKLNKLKNQVMIAAESIDFASEGSEDGQLLRSVERRKTFHVASAANRRQDEVTLSAESLADLHFLHETWSDLLLCNGSSTGFRNFLANSLILK